MQTYFNTTSTILFGISIVAQFMSTANAEPCAVLVVSGCEGTVMETDITGNFEPYTGSCDNADTSRSMYVRKTSDKDIYLFYHSDRDRWYFDAAGYNPCGDNYKHQLSTEFEGGEEPWIDISWNGHDGEADCYDGLDGSNQFSFTREPISIQCDPSGAGGPDTGSTSQSKNETSNAIIKQKNGFLNFIVAVVASAFWLLN